MKKVIVLTGPTGVGKTEISIKLSQDYNGEIINADASQIYKRLDIGTAKISEKEMKTVKHHLIDFLDVNEEFSIKDYQDLGRKKLEEIELPFVVGGSGLYIQALLTDYSLDENTRSKEEDTSSTNQELYNQLQKLDPQFAAKTHPNNRRRVLRYLEIAKEKGSVSKRPPCPLYDTLTICFTRPREILYQRINRRCEMMFDEGWIDECIALKNDGYDLSKLKNIGYSDINLYLNGIKTLDETKEIIKQKQRRYAKRQMTWFRNKMDCVFVELEDIKIDDVKKVIDEFLIGTKKNP